MPNTYYDSDLTGEQIEAALNAIHGVVTQESNGKVLAIEAGKIVAKSASEWTDTPVLEPLSVTANGDYTPEAGVDGFNAVHVAVSGGGGGTIEPLSVTQNGTYNPPSGVDGYAPVTVNVSGGGGGGAIVSPSYRGLACCYVEGSGQALWAGTSKITYMNFFEVQANHMYALFVGPIIGNRRRATFCAGKTFADFSAYIDTPVQSDTLIYSGGEWLAPFVQWYDDTENALAGRITYLPSQNGVIVFGTDNTGKYCPAYCIDLGDYTSRGVVAYRISTKSTNGSDAAINITKGICEHTSDIFVPTENPSSVVYTSVSQSSSFYNIGDIATLDYHRDWQVYATAAITDGANNYAAGERVKQWTYNTSVDFVIYKSQL